MPTDPREALSLAKQATNGWACYATRKIEHDEIARLHGAIDELAAALLLSEAAARDAERKVAYLRNVCVLFHNALTGHMMAGRFNHQLCERADDLWVAYEDAEIAKAPLPPQEKQ